MKKFCFKNKKTFISFILLVLVCLFLFLSYQMDWCRLDVFSMLLMCLVHRILLLALLFHTFVYHVVMMMQMYQNLPWVKMLLNKHPLKRFSVQKQLLMVMMYPVQILQKLKQQLLQLIVQV
jgi:hypothetical protein